MRIKVIVPEENININFPVPLGLFLNRITCPLLAKYANKYTNGFNIDGNQLFELIKVLNDSKKIFGHYDLVDIESKDGEIIKIRI